MKSLRRSIDVPTGKNDGLSSEKTDRFPEKNYSLPLVFFKSCGKILSRYNGGCAVVLSAVQAGFPVNKFFNGGVPHGICNF